MFQSTLPARGSDVFGGGVLFYDPRFQSTLPARGSDILPILRQQSPVVSIHAPREGERRRGKVAGRSNLPFQSTLPARGSDIVNRLITPTTASFNPRSPRGGATSALRPGAVMVSFNPRSPRGGATPPDTRPSIQINRFNPRSPRGGATVGLVPGTQYTLFQSTLPARGSDCKTKNITRLTKGFNPRSPRGGATINLMITISRTSVSIHAPREGERHGATHSTGKILKFQSTLPARGSDIQPRTQAETRDLFQSTLPARGSDP